jgi:hypothetical protein
MTARDEFSKELQAGRFQHALATAIKDAIELQVITWVSSGDGYDWSQGSDRPLPGQRMQTRINIVEGDIENEIGREFLDGLYQELRPFHEDQVERGFDIIHENLRTIQELFKVLMHFRQGNRPLSGAPDAGTMELASVDLDESATPLDDPVNATVDESIPAIAADTPVDDARWSGDSDWGAAIEDSSVENVLSDGDMTTATREAMTQSGMMGTGDLDVSDILYQPESMDASPEPPFEPSMAAEAEDALSHINGDMDLDDLMYDEGVDEVIESAAPPISDPVSVLNDDPELAELAFEPEETLLALDEADAMFEASVEPPPVPGDEMDVSELIFDENPSVEPDAIAPDYVHFDPSTVLDADPDLADLSFHSEGDAAIAPDVIPEMSSEPSAVTDVDIPDELTQQLQNAAAQTQQEPIVMTDVSEELHLLELDLLNVETEADLELMVEPGNFATNLRSLAETTPLNPRPAPPSVSEPTNSTDFMESPETPETPETPDTTDTTERGEEALGESIAPPEAEVGPISDIDYSDLQSDSDLDDFNFISDDNEFDEMIQSMTSDSDESPALSTDPPDAIADDILADLPDLSDESDPSEAIEMSEEELSDLFDEGSRADDSDDWDAEFDGAEFDNDADGDVEEEEFTSTEVTADALQDFEAFLGEAEAALLADEPPAESALTDEPTDAATDGPSDFEDLLFSDDAAGESELADPNDPFQAIASDESIMTPDTPSDDPLGLFSDSDTLDELDTESSTQPGEISTSQDDPLGLFADEGLAGDVATLEELSDAASSTDAPELESLLEESLEQLDADPSSQSVDDDDLLDLADLLMENMPESSQEERDRSSLRNMDVPDPWEDLN